MKFNLGSISINFGITSVSRLALGGIGLIVVGFLTRHLGPAGYGEYSAILAYLFLFATLADLGLYTILTREISRPGADESKIAGNIFSLRFTVVSLAAVAANIAALALPYSGQVKLGIFIASAFLVFSSLSQVLMGIFQKHLKIYLVSVADVSARLFQLAGVLALVYLEASFLWFVGLVAAVEILHFFLIFKFAGSLVKISFIFDKKYWLRIVKTALPIAASLVFVLIYFKLDTFLLSVMKPPRDVGIYSVAYKIMEFGIFFPAAYLGLMMPLLSRYAVSAKSRFRDVFQSTFDKLSILGWPAALFAIIFADRLAVLIGGGEFADSAAVLRILSLAMFIIFFGNLGGHSLVALNLQKKGMWIYMSGMVFNLAGNIILIPRFSYFAAAWTTVATEVIVTVLMFVVIKRAINTAPRLGLFFRAFAAALIMSAAILVSGGASLIAGIALAPVVYLPALYLLGGLPRKYLEKALFWQ